MRITTSTNLQDKLTKFSIELSSEKDIKLFTDIIALAEQQVQHYEEFSSGLPEMLNSIKKSL